MKFIEIENKAGRVALNDNVNKDSIDQLLHEINAVFGAEAALLGNYSGELTNHACNAADTLEITINSGGGSVFEGYRLYNAIEEMRARGVYVVAKIDTLAASMGSVVAMAADKVVMVKNGRMMIHEVSAGTHGNAAELIRVGTMCEEMSREIAGIYSAKTTIPADEIRALMKLETWMNAEYAIEKGFIDEIHNPLTNNKFTDKHTEITNTNNMFFKSSAELAAHKAEIEKLSATVEGYKTDFEKFNESLKSEGENHAAEKANFEAKIKSLESEASKFAENLTAAIAGKDAIIDELTAKAAINELKIGEYAAKLLATQGHGQPLKIGNEDIVPKTENTRPRDDIQKMPPAEILAFVKNGGKFI